jgi:hypothetical protein
MESYILYFLKTSLIKTNKAPKVKPTNHMANVTPQWRWLLIESKLVPSKQAGDACALGMPLFQQGEITNKIMCGIVEYDEAIEHPILSA